MFALYKRVTMSDSLTLLFTKERCEQIPFVAHVSDSLMTWADCLQIKSDWLKNVNFCMVLTVFPLLYAQEKNSLCHSSLIRSLLKSVLSDSLPSFFIKEWPWVICSGLSWQKSTRDWFAQVAHDKRATGVIHSFSQVNYSFVHKKQGNRWKNQWANSQPWHNPKTFLVQNFFSMQNYNFIDILYICWL